jgi:hypothetical protein
MMVLSALRPDASLFEFLANRARSASIHRLSIDLVIGIAGAWAAVQWRPFAWLVLTSAGLCFAAYGGWGLADRARTRTIGRGYGLLAGAIEAVAALLAAVGVIAAAAVLLGVWAIALGTWIS